MRLVFLALSILAAAAAPARACTQQELQAKSQAYAARLQDLAARDPKRVQHFTAKLQEAAKKLQEAMQNSGGLAEVCRFYDELIAELER